MLDAPIVVCLGNPPYRRARRRSDRWSLIGSLSRPVGVHAKNLYNEYVYFWRWALGNVFEQRRGPGIVSFVTAASYLRGPAFGGLRQSVCGSVLDELWIVDLEGDHLAARRPHNVFPIRTPVAIAHGRALRRAQRTRPARRALRPPQGQLGGREARGARRHRRLDDQAWQLAGQGWRAPLMPAVQRAPTRSWPKLTDLFPWQLSGAQLKRTWPIGADAGGPARSAGQRLLDVIGERAARSTRRAIETSTRPHATCWIPACGCPPYAAWRLAQPCIEPVRYAYRSFDRQWVLPDARLGDFMRPALWRVAGPRQIFLTSLLTNVLGPGPAAVATALVPDLDHFRGSFGARAVIPLWCDCGGNAARTSRPACSQRLSAVHGREAAGVLLRAARYTRLRGALSRRAADARAADPA